MDRGDNFVRVTASGIIYRGPCLFSDLIAHHDGTADDVSVYDGLDSASGLLFGTLAVNLYTNDVESPRHPVFFQRGIYVVLGTHITEVTVCYKPVVDDPPVVLEQKVEVVYP